MWITLLVCAVAAPWWNIPRDQADSAGMLAHLHALFVDADLLFDNEYAALGMSPLFAFVTEPGVVSNHWPAGATWLQAPGYLLGLAVSKALATVGIGRGSPLGTVVLLSVRAWAVVVLAVLARAIARAVARWQPDFEQRPHSAARAGVIVAVLAVVGTPLLYYATEAPLRPHLWGAALCAWLVLRWAEPPGFDDDEDGRSAALRRTFVLASIAGMATYVRPQLGPVWLLVAHDASAGPRRGRRGLIAALGFVPWLLLHARVQWWMYGEGLLGMAGEVSHHTMMFLTSTHHGVLPWCPLLLLPAACMVYAAVARQRGAWLLLLLVVWQVWLDGGMRAIEPGQVLGTRTWSGGVSFGPRKLVDVLPLALPAVAFCVGRARARGRGGVLAAVAVALSLPTVALHVSAWLDPGATTGGIMGAAEYSEALWRWADPPAWSRAWSQRSLPGAVTAGIGALVALPLWLLLDRASSKRVRSTTAVGVALLLLLLMHGFIAVVLMRSDAAREAAPQRMLAAAARMQPAHLATVRRIASHHAVLRTRLGPDAAPP